MESKNGKHESYKKLNQKCLYISHLQTGTQHQEGNYSFFEGYALERRLNTWPTTRNWLDCLSFSTVGIAVDEEKLSLRRRETKLKCDTRYCKIQLVTNHTSLSSKETLVQIDVIWCICDECYRWKSFFKLLYPLPGELDVTLSQ